MQRQINPKLKNGAVQKPFVLKKMINDSCLFMDGGVSTELLAENIRKRGNKHETENSAAAALKSSSKESYRRLHANVVFQTMQHPRLLCHVLYCWGHFWRSWKECHFEVMPQ
jgi:hypothetical protein